MAHLDPRYRLVAAVTSRDATYTVQQHDLDNHLVPKRGQEPTRETLHATQRGIAYAKPAFAYVFRLTGGPTTEAR